MNLQEALLELADGPQPEIDYASPWYAGCVEFITGLFEGLQSQITILQAAVAALPSVKVTSLPAAGEVYYGQIYILQDAQGDDTVHICVKVLDAYTWRPVTLL